MFARILWPVDPRKPAPPPVALLRSLAESEEQVVQVVAVIEAQNGIPAAWDDPPVIAARQLFHSDVRRDLRTLVRRAEAEGLTIDFVVLDGSPLRVVLRELQTRGCDLLAIRTRAIEENGGRIGGLTFDLLLHAPTPVCCVRDVAADFAMRRILVATDFSQHSISAFETALSLAQKHGASIGLVHLISRKGFPLDDDARVRLHEEAKRALKRWRASNAGLSDWRVPVDEVVCESDEAGSGILEQADAMAADMIVIAAQGWSALSPVFFGSTARRVVRKAKVPVLVTRGAGGTTAET